MAMRINDSELQTGQPPKGNSNAWLDFSASSKTSTLYFRHLLWLNDFQQTFGVTGSSSQSRTRSHWYPRSMNLGTVAVTVSCASQEDYQHLANFVRRQHEEMLANPGMRYTNDLKSHGAKTLMGLTIPSEGFMVRGWISNFTRLNQGFAVVAPEVKFDFFVAIAPYSVNPAISHAIREFWSPKTMKSVGQLEAEAGIRAAKEIGKAGAKVIHDDIEAGKDIAKKIFQGITGD